MRPLVLLALGLAAAATVPISLQAATGSRIDGVYETNYTKAQFLAATNDPEENNPENWGRFRLVLKRGHVTYSQLSGPRSRTSGTYRVTGDRITLRAVSDPGEVWNFAWKLSPDRRTLTFKKQGPIGPTGFIVKPWRRVG